MYSIIMNDEHRSTHGLDHDSYSEDDRLQIACQKGDLNSVKDLITKGVNPRKTEYCKQINTPLHQACWGGHLDVVKYLVEELHCDVYCTSGVGWNALHCCCSRGQLDVLKYLVDERKYDVNQVNRDGWTPLHTACWAGFLDIAKYLIEDKKCDAHCVDFDGMNPLDWCCAGGVETSLDLLEYLLKVVKCDASNALNQGFFNNHAIRLLLAYGAKPRYKIWNKFLKVIGPQKPAEAYAKLFLVGFPGGGKSTLAKSIECKVVDMQSRFEKVTGVNCKTAGIVLHDIVNDSFGRLTIYDLAGHSEFYASHDVSLRSALAGSPSSIILLVADASGGCAPFRKSLLHWCSFTTNLFRCSDENRPFLIVVGSHADTASAEMIRSCQDVVESFRNTVTFSSFRFKDFVALDCRYPVSSDMTKLRSTISECCQRLKQEQLLNFREHCFLVSVLDKFRGVPAVTIDNVISETADSESSATPHQSFLPSDPESMADICIELNKRGNILFLHDQEHAERSWIVLQKDVLLQRVNGSIFAPKEFKEYCDIASDTGIIPTSKLSLHFPGIDCKLIVSFMCHLQFCHPVTDPEILQQLSVVDDHSSQMYLFFPGLVTITVPRGVWDPTSEFTYQSVWFLECHNPDQFLSSRFLHVTIHHLAFGFAMAPGARSVTRSDCLSIQRRCSVWKNGISWRSLLGIDVIVEVEENRKVTVFIRSRKSCELDAVHLRSQVISRVLKSKDEYSPSVDVNEFFVKSDSISYPLCADTRVIEISEIAKSITSCKRFAYDTSDELVDIDSLLHFEPFSNLGPEILQELFAMSESEITYGFLAHISERTYPKIGIFIKVLDVSEFSLSSILDGAPPGDIHKLLRVLQIWRNRGSSYKNLCNELSEYSIFAGRNPLHLCS